jgi:hypothetical protein
MTNKDKSKAVDSYYIIEGILDLNHCVKKEEVYNG